MNILFYIPQNQRCRDLESLAMLFSKQGHKIFLYTQSDYGTIHKIFNSYGFATKASNNKINNTFLLTFYRIFTYISFCWKNKIHLTYSHLDPANYIAVLGQYFVISKVIICRHNIDEAKLAGYDKSLTYRLIYLLAKKIIVVSEKAKRYMIEEEKIKGDKIQHINIAYDFTLYGVPDKENIAQIKNKYSSQILLITVGRLNKNKRPEISIEITERLIKCGINTKLIILGSGDQLAYLKELVIQKEISNNVEFPGYVDNVLEYMAASDFLIHPSLSESSCVVIKEAGLVNLPVVICEGVGDFNEYIINNYNGFCISKDNFIEECLTIIKHYSQNNKILNEIGNNLKKSINNNFDISRVALAYEQIHSTIKF